MKIDNVYVAVINIIIAHDTVSMGRSFKDEYKTIKNYPDTGDLIVDVKTMKSYRNFLYNEQLKNHHLKVKDNMFKRKMLTLFNDAQKRGKMEVRDEKNIWTRF